MGIDFVKMAIGHQRRKNSRRVAKRALGGGAKIRKSAISQ